MVDLNRLAQELDLIWQPTILLSSDGKSEIQSATDYQAISRLASVVEEILLYLKEQHETR